MQDNFLPFQIKLRLLTGDNSLLFLSINTDILKYCLRVKEDDGIYFLYKLQWTIS